MKFTVEFDGKRYGAELNPGAYDAQTFAMELGKLVENTYLHYFDQKLIMEEKNNG